MYCPDLKIYRERYHHRCRERLQDSNFNVWKRLEVQYILYLTKMEGVSVCLSFDYLNNCSSNRLHTWRVYCWGPKEVQCRVWSCLDKQFSRKLQATIQEAKRSAHYKEASLERALHESSIILESRSQNFKINIVCSFFWRAVDVSIRFWWLPRSFLYFSVWLAAFLYLLVFSACVYISLCHVCIVKEVKMFSSLLVFCLFARVSLPSRYTRLLWCYCNGNHLQAPL